MIRQKPEAPAPHPFDDPQDSSAGVRIFAAWMGLLLVAVGAALAGYLMYRIGEMVLDPRTFETQVDRWEFVIRGRTTDAFPDTYETSDNKRIITSVPAPGASGDPEIETQDAPIRPGHEAIDQTEEMARFVGRLGSKSARPAALLLVMVLLMILVRILVAIMHAGIRLVYLTAGEKDYMKRIIDELAHRRDGPLE